MPSWNPAARSTPRSPWVIAVLAAAAACTQAPRGPLEIAELPTPAQAFSGQAHLSATADGSVVLNWLEPTEDDGMALKYATLASDGDVWSAPRELAQGADWFINWADFPSVVPIAGERWAAHWLVFQEDYGGYDIYLSWSEDAGASWGTPVALNTDGLPAEHGFVTLFPLDGNVGAVWLDGRHMVVDGEVQYFDANGDVLGTSLRYALLDPSGERLADMELDALVCDCCQPDVAITSAGPILTYRERTPEEYRDIVVSRMREGSWQGPQALPPDGWQISGCPINGSAIAAAGDDVVVAWFTAANGSPVVRFARSADAGATFGSAVDVDTAGSFGHVDVALLSDGEAVVSWLRSAGDGLALVARRISRDGELGPVETVARGGNSRPIDFPQMIAVGDRLIFAWTDFERGSDVKTAVGRYGR